MGLLIHMSLEIRISDTHEKALREIMLEKGFDQPREVIDELLEGSFTQYMQWLEEECIRRNLNDK